MSTTTELVRISELRGAALPLESCRFPLDTQGANALLLMLCQELCHAVEVSSGSGGFTATRIPATAQKRLSEVPAADLESAVRRSRVHLEGGDATRIIDELDNHFARAQRRRQREG